MASRAISSAGEHCLHMAEVTGSIPVSPTTYRPRNHWAAAFRRAASRSAGRDFGLDELRQVESVPGQHLGNLLDAAHVGNVVAVMPAAQHLAGTAARSGKPHTPDPPRPTDQFHASSVRASPALALCQPGPTGSGHLLPPRRLRGISAIRCCWTPWPTVRSETPYGSAQAWRTGGSGCGAGCALGSGRRSNEDPLSVRGTGWLPLGEAQWC